jgi:hypothetical protein
MIATGVSLACTLGCKMVGLLTFLSVGSCVLVDLWNLLDIKRGYTLVSSERVPSKERTVLTFTSGTRCQALLCPCPRINRYPRNCLSLILLRPFQNPQVFGNR